MGSTMVIVLGTRIATQTDGTGMFKLVVPDSGVYTIQVMYPGVSHEKQQRSVNVVAGRTTTLIVRLKKAQLPEGTVLDTVARY